MKFVAKECPKCHAPLDTQARFCSHCRTAVVLEDDVDRTQYTYQEVDDARIREADVKENIRLKELEIEQLKLQDEINHRKQTLMVKLAMVLSFFAVMLVMLLLYAFTKDKYGNPDDTYGALTFLMVVAMCIVFPFVFRKNK